jgi:signal transduction histidine kinase
VFELRRLVGILREGDEPAALAPLPGLAQLSTLVEQVRATGLQLDLAVEGEPAATPPGLELSAYRVVQEALTNVIKHSGTDRASVQVRYGSDDLELEILDDGDGDGVVIWLVGGEDDDVDAFLDAIEHPDD